ncbi:MAG: sensor histidine kinase [Pseudomonadota bacterium]
MRRAASLRLRLTLIILGPLLVIAFASGLWQLETARRTATDVFDRSLLSAALAVYNDVTLSGGDALSPRTRGILADTSGGLVFYHVYAPDGVIVAGYATPPVGIPLAESEETGPAYFEATYLGRSVRGVRLQYRAEIEGFSGIFTTTVWQDQAVRDAFVRDLVLRALVSIGGLTACVALVVWFGVRIGLRPLLDLQGAIKQRSSDELSPIARPVPEEVRGIVETLNELFRQVSRSLTAQSEFISNAAHQLRNPIAGVLSLAEAVDAAPNEAEARRRSADLLVAARETADLTQKLLTMERAKAVSPEAFREHIDIADCLEDWAPMLRANGRDHVAIEVDADCALGTVTADPTMLREALANLVDNALRHGGPDLSRIDIKARRAPGCVRIGVADDGCGIPSDAIAAAKERFSQLSPASGSGLGLPIAAAIAEAHGGEIEIRSRDKGLEVTLMLPAPID